MPVKFRSLRNSIANVVGGGAPLGLTAHEVCIGGAAGQLAQVPALGDIGQQLTSNGPGADPSWSFDVNNSAENLEFPTGLGYTVRFESLRRKYAQTGVSTTSGTSRLVAVPIYKGTPLGQLTMVVGNTGQAGGAHGWYALLDNTLKVLSTTADQTGATVWSPAGAAITLALSIGSTPTAPYSGVYYVEYCNSSTTPPNFCAQNIGALTGAIALTPFLAAQGASLQTTPPVVGTTRTTTAFANVEAYVCGG